MTRTTGTGGAPALWSSLRPRKETHAHRYPAPTQPPAGPAARSRFSAWRAAPRDDRFPADRPRDLPAPALSRLPPPRVGLSAAHGRLAPVPDHRRLPRLRGRPGTVTDRCGAFP